MEAYNPHLGYEAEVIQNNMGADSYIEQQLKFAIRFISVGTVDE
ncbi:hypothetical protein [Paenibacillus alvei]|nr:hypothetical protein [Paenibacillus alvei]